jgi:uncharacterized protein
MEQRISVITLAVGDLGRARRFYEAGLGWQPAFASDEVVFFQAGGLVVSLFPALADELPTPGGAPSPGGIALAHNVRSPSEVDQAVAEVVAAGGSVLAAPEQREWGGYSGYVADPDGHPWEVAYNPGWPIAVDGSVTVPTD